MSRSTMWFIGAALFLVAAIASAIGSQWIGAAAAAVIAIAFAFFGLRGNKAAGRS
ncbi:hypothetical protein GCM10027413_13100 [Conyzicola nivalis]|uniref:Uncharacterized protein n=1 Tax=Conyzicola nivalis TaxID=1477021 RepID=A0A916SH52_9MICO|nr:hypothetical protein [Conyzicola nivalis]GGB00365.1 hypothetical protein GCM10010979_13530 [Conyzicola nivalis]